MCRLAAKEPPVKIELKHICGKSQALRDKNFSPQPSGPPPFYRVIGNAIGAVARATDAVAHGKQLMVDDAEFERRMAICRGCEHYENDRCKKCGCFLNLKARLQSESGQCPVGKW
jgi:hypothetical protein